MSYTLELAPELAEQLHALAEEQHKNEADVLLAAVQEYLLRQRRDAERSAERWRANIQTPDSEAWMDGVEQEGWHDAAW